MRKRGREDYAASYKEVGLLGKGNYGKAFRVRSLRDGKLYVAKKVFLEGLAEAEVKAAWNEIEILAKFSELEIPFIVQYKECFGWDAELVIVMEYCEGGRAHAGGDLSSFLGRCRERGEVVQEHVVGHWLIQLLWGLQALHSKSVLHRDLKSANIFVTANFTLKIGDFGISKVLDSTSAQTCIGTPLYLSPEVCNAQPYSYGSDLWALGCVLYELCTLRYPFQGSNLIVLARKIVCDKPPALPSFYSRDLDGVVMQPSACRQVQPCRKLLEKDWHHRATITELIKSPYLRKYLASFTQDEGKIAQIVVPLSALPPTIASEFSFGEPKVKFQEAPAAESGSKAEAEDTIQTAASIIFGEKTDSPEGASNGLSPARANPNSASTTSPRSGVSQESQSLELSASLTPQQRRQLRREQQTLRKIEEAKKAAKETADLRKFAKESKESNLKRTGQTSNQSLRRELEKQYSRQNQAQAQDRHREKEMTMKQKIDLAFIKETLNQIVIRDNDDNFEDVPLPPKALQAHSPQTAKQRAEPRREEPAKSESPGSPLGSVAPQSPSADSDEDYYEDDFEEYIADEEVTSKELKDIRAFYENEMGVRPLSPKAQEKMARVFEHGEIRSSSRDSKIRAKQNEAVELVGRGRFEELSSLVRKGQIDMRRLKSNFTAVERRAIQAIEEIVFLESSR